MPKLIVSIDGVVIKEALLTKDRSTIGRRPYNDVVIDNLAVSGEHAVIQMAGPDAVLEDLGSTNGTFVNGRAVRKHTLADGDVMEIGRCAVRYLVHAGAAVDDAPSSEIEGLESDLAALPEPPAGRGARVRVLTGAARGRELPLTKPVTTIGRAGFSVAAIRRSAHGFELAHVEGAHVPSVNGVSVEGGPIALQNRDQIAMGAVRLEYLDV
ncbi:MAG: FHA domain-containing protein [Burkholderiales bacterium]|uniref:FHA domain-containing protein n=1 Tax=Ottowia pentelensis TaxID=511108 RepID=A0ABV6PVI8_9BURK|nr:FHA domain-containing protein [Ottowia sp.]MBN9407147.1 FHA domain-containing protein [Burkholderiales bacterium]MBS0401651.1 FHA domain-containing protein [Pseudomonadota bacterium]MBS0414110.1 FHA domain-containing protein [Pseudomonadota bacterium]